MVKQISPSSGLRQVLELAMLCTCELQLSKTAAFRRGDVQSTLRRGWLGAMWRIQKQAYAHLHSKAFSQLRRQSFPHLTVSSNLRPQFHQSSTTDHRQRIALRPLGQPIRQLSLAQWIFRLPMRTTGTLSWAMTPTMMLRLLDSRCRVWGLARRSRFFLLADKRAQAPPRPISLITMKVPSYRNRALCFTTRGGTRSGVQQQTGVPMVISRR